MAQLRRGVASVLGLVGALLLLLAFAAGDARQPWLPEARLALDPAQLQSTTSRLLPTAEGLRIEGAGSGGGSVVMQAFDPFPASRFRYFRLRLDAAGVEQRALLVLRSGGRSSTALMPGGLRGEVVLDLASVPEWQGEIDAVGVLIAPVDFLAAAEAPSRSPLLHTAVLESPSLLGAARATLSRWLAYRPLSGRSINTGGFEYGRDAGPSLSGFVAALLVWGGLMMWFAGVSRLRVRLLQTAALACALLGLAQLAQLWARAEVATTAAFAVPEGSDWPLAASPPLAQMALELERQLAADPPARLLVWANERFLGEYPVWLLRRYNVANWPSWSPLPSDALRSGGGLHVLVVGQQGWQFEAARGELLIGEQALAATLVWQGGEMRLFELATEAAP